MRTLNDKLLDAVPVSLSQVSDAALVDHCLFADIVATITGNNPSNKTFATGVMDVKTFTFPALADAVDGNYISWYNTAGLRFAIAMDTTGLAAATPTGAIWASIASARKSYYDISGATTAADVAALVETGMNLLTGLTSSITTDDTAADGTMTLTQIIPGVVPNAVPKNKNDSGAGTITTANTTPGTATDVDITADSLRIVGHNLLPGTKISGITSTGSIPGGLSNTTYYVLVLDVDHIQLATSQGGSAVNITDYGTTGGVTTLAIATSLAGTVKLQKNDEPVGVAANWVDLVNAEVVTGAASQTFAAAATLSFALKSMGYRELRCIVTTTSGTVLVTIRINAKGF